MSENPPLAPSDEVAFCCTNLDLYSLSAYRELCGFGVAPRIVHCLGLCHVCAERPIALVKSSALAAGDNKALVSAVRSLLAAPLRGGNEGNSEPSLASE